MAGASLSEKQQQLLRDLVRLCQLSQHRSFRYTPAFNNHDTIEAKGTSSKINGGERDLRTLETDGFISLRWVRHGAADGTVSQAAFDAVRDNFGLPPAAAVPAEAPEDAGAAMTELPTVDEFVSAPAPTSVPSRAAPAGSQAAAPSQGRAAAQSAGDVPGVLSGLLADLTTSLRQALPADEAEASEADAGVIRRQLAAARPDADVVARRVRSITSRIAAATGNAADLASRGGKLADALQRLSSFVALLSHWAAAQRTRA